MIYYLKCINCGSLNEVKTEYLTLCSHCGAKLNTNYKLWLQRLGNERKTFEEYKKEACISQTRLEEMTLDSKRECEKRKEERELGFFSIIFKILAVVAIIISPILAFFISLLFEPNGFGHILICILNLVIAAVALLVNIYLLLARKIFFTFAVCGLSLLLTFLIDILLYYLFVK